MVSPNNNNNLQQFLPPQPAIPPPTVPAVSSPPDDPMIVRSQNRNSAKYRAPEPPSPSAKPVVAKKTGKSCLLDRGGFYTRFLSLILYRLALFSYQIIKI